MWTMGKMYIPNVLWQGYIFKILTLSSFPRSYSWLKGERKNRILLNFLFGFQKNVPVKGIMPRVSELSFKVEGELED